MLREILQICYRQLQILKLVSYWQVSIVDVIESLHTENMIFKQNKSLFVTELLKHKNNPNYFPKPKCLDEDTNKLFEKIDKSDLPQVGDEHFTPGSDDELAKLTPDFQKDTSNEETKDSKY